MARTSSLSGRCQPRAHARQLWRDEGWVFATPTGSPLNHNSDYHEWKRLLKAAGLRESRLHDARHTAATVLLILGQPERTVMSLMGWSSTDMAKRYQHVTDTVRTDVANQVGSLIWAANFNDTTAATVSIRRRSLATILPLVEEGLLNHSEDDDTGLTALGAALDDLRTAMSENDGGAAGEVD